MGCGCTLTLTNSTVSGNSAGSLGGGVYNGGNLVLIHTLISGNTAPTAPEISQTTYPGYTATVDNFNLFGVNGNAGVVGFTLSPGGSDIVPAGGLSTILLPLALNSPGTTQTHALPIGSPAIDAVLSGCPPPGTDQRGITRPQGAACDIGAFELVPPVCGNGVVESGEQCEDLNTTSGDGCSATCQSEPPGGSCPVCGNETIEGIEACDDGNTEGGDGCSATCQIEVEPPTCPVCGNGTVEGIETCDDGNTVNGDCCSSVCQPEDLGTTTCGVGACSETVDKCVNGEPQACTPGTPGPELCNGIDDNCDGRNDIMGTEGFNVLTGTPGDDVLVGLGGPDVLNGQGGNDLLCGGAGLDICNGGPGTDTAIDCEVKLQVP